MLFNAVGFYGCMALLFIGGVSTDSNAQETVENCQEKIDVCKRLASTDKELVSKQTEIVTCFTGFFCKDSEDDSRVKALLDYGKQIANAADALKDPDQGPSSLGLTIRVSYKTLIISAVTAFFLAWTLLNN